MFTWIPDPAIPNEPPPKSVIVTKSASAKGGGGSSPDITPTGNVATGLGQTGTGTVILDYAYAGPGNPPQVIGKYTSIEISETKYEVVMGGPTVTVSCSPSGSGTGNRGAGARVTFSASATAVQIDLTGETIQGSEIKALAGQKIRGNLTPSSQLKDASWTIEGDVFKSYPFNQSVCHVELLSAADKVGMSTEFFGRIKGTVTLTANATVIVPPGATSSGSLAVTAERIISIDKPTATNWTILSGFVQSTPTDFGFRGIAGTTTQAGQTWREVAISVPSPFIGGTGCFAQLWTPNRKIFRHLPLGAPSSASSYYQHINNTMKGLGTSFPYPIVTNSQYTWTVPAVNPPAGDSPSQPLYAPDIDNGGVDWYLSEASDSFVTYLMYLPPPKDGMATTWIPLQSYNWSWSGVMQKTTTTWDLISANPAATGASPSRATDADDHPEWDRINPSPFWFTTP